MSLHEYLCTFSAYCDSPSSFSSHDCAHDEKSISLRVSRSENHACSAMKKMKKMKNKKVPAALQLPLPPHS